MQSIQITGAKTNNSSLLSWIDTVADLTKPDRVHICNGSQEEYNHICEQMVESGTFIRINPEKRPNCFLSRSDPRDVARTEATGISGLVRYQPVA